MPEGHWSSCSLHRAPAMRPHWCDCGGIEHKPTFQSNLKNWAQANYWHFKGKIVWLIKCYSGDSLAQAERPAGMQEKEATRESTFDPANPNKRNLWVEK